MASTIPDSMENTSIPNGTDLLEDQVQADVENWWSSGGDMFTLIAHLITFFVGMPGNCLILRVYWTKIRKTSTHVLIMALAWADLSVCLLRWQRISAEALLLDGKLIPMALDMIFPVTTTAVTTSVLITTVIAVDRYDCVCRSHNRCFTPRRAKLAVGAALLLSFAFNIPAFVAISIYTSNGTVRMLVLAFQVLCFVTALVTIVLCYGLVYLTIGKHVQVRALSTRQNRNGLKLSGKGSTMITLNRVSKVCDKKVPVIAMITNSDAKKIDSVATKYLGVPGLSLEDKPPKNTIRRSKLAILRNGSSAENDFYSVNGDRNPCPLRPNKGGHAQMVKAARLRHKTTRMLFITSGVFLLTWLPYWTRVVVQFASYGGASINPTFLDILKKSSVALYINTALNPLIYGVANRRFRKDCREVLRKIRPW